MRLTTMNLMRQGLLKLGTVVLLLSSLIMDGSAKPIALSRIKRRPLRLDLARYPHLPKMDVRTTAAADYAVLVKSQAA